MGLLLPLPLTSHLGGGGQLVGACQALLELAGSTRKENWAAVEATLIEVNQRLTHEKKARLPPYYQSLALEWERSGPANHAAR
jgi:hypothetical protein